MECGFFTYLEYRFTVGDRMVAPLLIIFVFGFRRSKLPNMFGLHQKGSMSKLVR
jgi:hypothetical protein